MTVTANPYLEGNYAPVHEEITATDLNEPMLEQMLQQRHALIDVDG